MIKNNKAGKPGLNLDPDNPFSQYHGDLDPVGGSVPSFEVPAGSVLHSTDTLLIQDPNDATEMVWLTGFIDGDVGKGKVSYLGGHEYNVNFPVSGNGQTNGVRLFLNSLFESPCTTLSNSPHAARLAREDRAREHHGHRDHVHPHLHGL